MPINIVKGMHDIFQEEALEFSAIEDTLKAVANLFGYTEFRTPILEHTELFLRSVGESSDVVRKEMYTFLDKGERSVTMRPELTAGVMRLIVANKLYATQDLPIKASYLGPSFRYERPGLGRYRQFHQFGVECVGINSYFHDVETIILGLECLQRLGLDQITIKINTLGDAQSRENYKNALRSFFADKVSKMCPDCQERYRINPLRILDCKVPEDQELLKNAPKMSKYLTMEAKEHFAKIIEQLDKFQTPYVIDESLVRGLDYYSHVVFEYHYTTKKDANYGAIGAGGHYDNLIEEIGGPKLSGVGFAMGIERIHAAMHDDELLNDIGDDVDIYVMPLDESTIDWCFNATLFLRSHGYRTEISIEKRNIKQLFKRAEKLDASLALIVGEVEFKEQKVILRDLQNKTQKSLPLGDLMMEIETYFRAKHKKAQDCECEHYDCGDEGCSCHKGEKE